MSVARELAILVPVLRRPHRVAPLLTSIRQATPGHPRIIFIADADDEPELAELRRHLDYGVTDLGVIELPPPVNYATKINVAVRETTEPLVFLGADDLEFHAGWLEAAKAKLEPGIGVVGVNDLANERVMRGELATHSLVTRDYAELGKIDGPELLHPEYPHEYVDREFTETAIARGAFAYAPDAVVEHLHPMVGKAPLDDLYRGVRGRMRLGRRIYHRRKRRWQDATR